MERSVARGKTAALKSAEETPFFQRLRSDFVVYFYRNPAIWPLFGYEGASNDQGGYLHRGFNEIASSASVFADDQRLALASGFTDFLPKPVLEEELFQIWEHIWS
jgi:hypothetical protein